MIYVQNSYYIDNHYPEIFLPKNSSKSEIWWHTINHSFRESLKLNISLYKNICDALKDLSVL